MNDHKEIKTNSGSNFIEGVDLLEINKEKRIFGGWRSDLERLITKSPFSFNGDSSFSVYPLGNFNYLIGEFKTPCVNTFSGFTKDK